MLPTDRISYLAITERAPLTLPDGARMVVWVIVDVEEWDPREPMPRTVLTPPGLADAVHSELISWSRKATTMWPTGCSTISRSGSRPAENRSSAFSTRRSATTSL